MSEKEIKKAISKMRKLAHQIMDEDAELLSALAKH